MASGIGVAGCRRTGFVLSPIVNTDNHLMKLPTTDYSPEATRRRLVAAKAQEPVATEPASEKREAQQVRKLFQSRYPQTRTYALQASDVNVGTIGVSNLDDLQALMSRYDSFSSLMEATGLRSRQSIHSALKDASETLSRAKERGLPVTRQIQHLVNAINATPDPLRQLCRFFLQMAPANDRRTMAVLMAVYFQIPLDSLVVIREQ